MDFSVNTKDKLSALYLIDEKLSAFFSAKYNVVENMYEGYSDKVIEEMKKVASESYRVLKKGKFCAILMGDTRQKGHMIPMSFEVMKIFQDVGFKLKELIIKEQHNCQATGFWKTNSVKYNFLLIAHEYLFVFHK